MKQTIIFTASLLLALGLALAFMAPADAARIDMDTISTGSYDTDDAVVDLTPVSFEDGKLVVKVRMNTHSVDLGSIDLREAAVLYIDGRTIKPSEAYTPRGHHAYGKLVFDVGEEKTSFKIVLTGIPAHDERVYEW